MIKFLQELIAFDQIQGAILKSSGCERSEHGKVMGMQQEQAVTPVSQYAMRRHTFNIRTCVARVFVTCTCCAFTLLLWAKEQPSRLALNSDNPQQRLLKCFSKPTVMKKRAG